MYPKALGFSFCCFSALLGPKNGAKYIRLLGNVEPKGGGVEEQMLGVEEC